MAAAHLGPHCSHSGSNGWRFVTDSVCLPVSTRTNRAISAFANEIRAVGQPPGKGRGPQRGILLIYLSKLEWLSTLTFVHGSRKAAVR